MKPTASDPQLTPHVRIFRATHAYHAQSIITEDSQIYIIIQGVTCSVTQYSICMRVVLIYIYINQSVS